MNRNDTFYFQGILFANEINHRVLQNENGPCPLLALVNCLLLGGRFQMSISSLSGSYPISFKALARCLRDELQVVQDKLWEDGSEASEAKIIAIAKCTTMDIFPKLARGLDINIKFNDVQSFDMKELAHQLYDIYDLNIYHCWVIDPHGKYATIYPSIADKTYDEVQDMLLNTDSQHYTLIQDFLQNTNQQQTKYGVHRLYGTMRDAEIATLFHNNHYSTIYKHADDHLIYELVTDEGIVSEESNIIWKTFNPFRFVDGMDEIFVDANFNALNEFDAQQLTKLRKIIHCLRKYKYNINRTQDTVSVPLGHSDDSDTELDHLLLKKVDNTLEFIDKFPFNPLQCKMIFDEENPTQKNKKYEIKDDLKMKKIELDFMSKPQSIKRAMSDNVTPNHLGSIIGHKNTSDEYKIRNCRVEDIGVICKEFGYSNEILNERFWTKEFLTENTDRNGYVLEDHNSANIIGFILYERCEPSGGMIRTGADQLLLRDLSASTSISNDIDMHCKWKVSDWSSTKNGKISFYSQFILITDLGIHPQCRKKGYGSKLLQSIIYSFPSGTRFAVEIDSSNESAIHCFGKCGFMIKRMENNRFYMTAISAYGVDDVVKFKESSILKHDKKQIIKELKESKEKIKLKIQQQTTQKGDDDGKYDDDDEEIFIAPDVPELAVHTKDDDADGKDGKSDDEEDEKYEAEMVKEEFDPEKLNRLCSELCCMEHSMLVDCVLRIIESVIDDVYVRLDYDNLIRDMQNACYDPYGQNTKQMSDKDTNQYVDLALDILYCAGFVKRRFGDYEDERFHLSLADESDMWKLEATHELIAKYQLNMHDKKNRLDMLKAITFGGSNPIRYWKHIFDADAHGQTVRDRTVRLLKKICRGIIKNKDDLTHKTRNLNYALLRNKFECQIPLLLLQRHGFEQRENLYKGEIRFVYRHTDIKAIREMMSKIEDEEKCMSDQDILTSMPQRLQRLWIHVLSTIHGDHVRTVTITTIRQICNNIIKEPANLRHRDLDLQGLQRKFHCGVPLKLLMEYGFTKSVDPYRFEYRLRFDSSDITQIKTLLDVLEKGEKLNVMDIMKNMNRDGGMPMSVDQLRLIMALKALNDNQHMMNAWGDNANDLNIGMTPLTHPGHLGPFSGSGGPNTRGDAQRVLSAFDNNDNNNQFERSDMMGMNGSRMDTGDQEMEYMEMQSFLGTIGLASYAGSFIKNGIKTKHQLLKVDVSLIEFFIDNKMDQNKFINWLNSNKQTAAKNVGRISGI